MSEMQYNTHLAAEFFVMSALHRLGVNALLTLGNKKAVDIVVEKGADTLTVEVKGLASAGSFPIGSYTAKAQDKNHYYVFVSFLGKIGDPVCLPDVYIVPAKDLDGKGLVQHNKVNNVLYSELEKHTNRYKNNWAVFTKKEASK
ncbi:hypothetical protein AGMMS49579_18550 [Spirochaetia bacterium]|nr:hypothetical protein AGMMS49579_18550 [Spirochaetia bacterium]